MEKSALGGADLLCLQAVEGWLALGNALEALAELDHVSARAQHHPQVLDCRWQVNAALRDWDHALEAARLMLEQSPGDPRGWIHRAYALRRARSGGLQQAWDALLPAYDRFPGESIIPYNLACYATQQGRLPEAWDWLNRAIEAAEDITQIKEQALRDEDLRPLWDRIRSL
jgi:tetratricopeptide (TPR) repeat protein